MANNFINRGEVLTLHARDAREDGKPYRECGFNGVALKNADPQESYTLQIRGVFEFDLPGVEVGDLIYIDWIGELMFLAEDDLVNRAENTALGWMLFGRAVTSSDVTGCFQCLILQSE